MDNRNALSKRFDAGPMRSGRVWIGVKEAAMLLDLHTATVQRYCREGLFVGAYRLRAGASRWRIPADAVRQMMERDYAQTSHDGYRRQLRKHLEGQ